MSPPLHLLSVLLPLLMLLAVLAVVAGVTWYVAVGLAYAGLAVAELSYLAILLARRDPGLHPLDRRFVSGR